MTREEEIKARSQRTTGVEYIQPCSLDDIMYLIARNEELQRRVEKMERVCREVWDNSSGDTNGKMIVRGFAMMKVLDILDAKEHDDEVPMES